MSMVRSPDAIFRKLDGETIILGANTPEAFSLNEVGSWIWEYLAQERTEPQIIDAMSAHFGIDVDRARTDLQAFIGDLRVRGLLIERS